MRWFSPLLVAGVLLMSGSAALAQPFPFGSSLQDAARDGVRERQLVPMNQIISGLRQRNPGRLLDADLQQQRGGPVYAVRWLTDDGRRIDYRVDARTGEILSANGE
jgi:uncharacterized membrane protein YkoI